MNDKERSLIHLRSAIIGWENGEPIPKPIRIILSSMVNKKPFMSHVMVLARHYPSVGEARRAGWNKIAIPGFYKVKKGGIPTRPVEVIL